MSEEHRKNVRPSTRAQHEEGQARKRKDAGREKGDRRRRRHQRKRRRPQPEQGEEPIMTRETLNARLARLFRQDAWEEARALLEAEQAKDPDNHWLLTQRGVTLYEQRRYEEARQLFQASRKIVDDCPLTLWNLAGTLDALGKHTAAVRIYTWLLAREKSPQEDPCWESAAWTASLKADTIYRLGACFENLGKKHKAECCYRQYLDLLLVGVDGTYSIDEVTGRIRSMHHGRARRATGRELRKLVQAALQTSGVEPAAGRRSVPARLPRRARGTKTPAR